MNHQHDMAKIQIKSEKLTPFGGIFPIMEYFNSKLSPVIDRVLGLRCKQFYNQRGAKERIFDGLDNGFGWGRLPRSFMAENAVFLILTALIRNFYQMLMSRHDLKDFGLKDTSRVKAFVFRFVSVPAKWVRTARQHVLNIYSENKAYAKVFLNDFG